MPMTMPEPRRLPRPLIPRTFCVLAAILLVGAIAAATLSPLDTTLLQALHAMDPSLVTRVQARVTDIAGSALWLNLIQPVLVRPVWLVPLCLGMVCVGGAISASLPPQQQTRRKRS